MDSTLRTDLTAPMCCILSEFGNSFRVVRGMSQTTPHRLASPERIISYSLKQSEGLDNFIIRCPSSTMF